MTAKIKMLQLFLSFFLLDGLLISGEKQETPLRADPNGYIVYCPCMGRFGNQADQFLGALAFAKAQDRTLIVPPWIEYRPGHSKASMIPFTTYFHLEPIQQYVRAISMEEFMEKLAPTVWPPGQRKVFCYSARYGGKEKNECDAKNGNPFGPFWDSFNIDFDGSELHGPLYFDTSSPRDMSEWKRKYPPSEFPVLAFVGPPGSFPVSEANGKLQKYVQWSTDFEKKAEKFIQENIKETPFLAIHLRNGPDFERACAHISTSPSMFAAAQCIGSRGQFGPTTYEMCFPSEATIIDQVQREMEKTGAKTLFISTDYKDLRQEFSKALKGVHIAQQKSPASAMLDLRIMGQADFFIGNCISTFTGFVKRERDWKKLPSSFWAFEKKEKRMREDL